MSYGQRLDLEQRYQLSAMIRKARKERKLSLQQVAEMVSEELKRAAVEEPLASEEERAIWLNTPCSARQVQVLENFPSNPASSVESRARLKAVTNILGLDPRVVNRFCGGI